MDGRDLWTCETGFGTESGPTVADLNGDGEPAIIAITAIRTSPLIIDLHRQPAIVFGWMPDETDPSQARISALTVKLHGGEVEFEPRWTVSRGAWKSSPAWLPAGRRRALVVTGYGIGNTVTAWKFWPVWVATVSWSGSMARR